MENTKQNAVIFCAKSQMPDFMLQVESWLKDKFNLHYRNMPYGQTEELSCAWKGISNQISYIFIILDLRSEDGELIEILENKTEEEMRLYLEDHNSKWPNSFQLILDLGRESRETLESNDSEDEELEKVFDPCLITFSQKPFENMKDFLGLWGVSSHINKDDDIFSDQSAFVEEIELKAEQLIAITEQVKGFTEED